jgi:hypothetical protein
MIRWLLSHGSIYSNGVFMLGFVFFADILGFKVRSLADSAQPALDALSDVAGVLAENDELARYLQLDQWFCRYALSDSLFLVSENAEQACSAAAELFFNLAFLNSFGDEGVLLRGGVAGGNVEVIRPLFPETGSGNLVGEAVVKAVQLEASEVKGPRLFISEDVVQSLLQRESDRAKWIIDQRSMPAELLWLLPPNAEELNELFIGDVCRSAVDLFLRNCERKRVGLQYVGYLELIARSLERLKGQNFLEKAEIISRTAGFERINEANLADSVRHAIDEAELLDRLCTF